MLWCLAYPRLLTLYDMRSLNSLGISTSLYSLMCNFLLSLYKLVLVDGIISSSFSVNCGVPQGCIMSFLLFVYQDGISWWIASTFLNLGLYKLNLLIFYYQKHLYLLCWLCCLTCEQFLHTWCVYKQIYLEILYHNVRQGIIKETGSTVPATSFFLLQLPMLYWSFALFTISGSAPVPTFFWIVPSLILKDYYVVPF